MPMFFTWIIFSLTLPVLTHQAQASGSPRVRDVQLTNHSTNIVSSLSDLRENEINIELSENYTTSKADELIRIFIAENKIEVVSRESMILVQDTDFEVNFDNKNEEANEHIKLQRNEIYWSAFKTDKRAYTMHANMRIRENGKIIKATAQVALNAYRYATISYDNISKKTGKSYTDYTAYAVVVPSIAIRRNSDWSILVNANSILNNENFDLTEFNNRDPKAYKTFIDGSQKTIVRAYYFKY